MSDKKTISDGFNKLFINIDSMFAKQIEHCSERRFSDFTSKSVQNYLFLELVIDEESYIQFRK